MIKLFKRWEEVIDKLEKLLTAVSKLQRAVRKEMKSNEAIVEINRHQIGLIELSDVDTTKQMSDSERKIYLQKAESIWANDVFQKEVGNIIQKQMEFAVCQTSGQDQTYIARGTINGVSLLHERLEELHNEYQELSKPPQVPGKDFDRFKMIPE